MGLSADEFAQEARSVGRKKRCEICRVLTVLDKKDRAVLDQQLAADPLDVSHGAIANVLKRHGHQDVNTNWVRSHRERTCSGFRS